MEWKRGVPAQPGWYWVRVETGTKLARFEPGGSIYISGTPLRADFCDAYYFAGPLTPPEFTEPTL